VNKLSLSFIFRVIVPLDDEYSFDAGINKAQNLKGKNCTLNCTLTEKAILEFLENNSEATQADIALAIGKSLRTIKTDMAILQEKGLLKREGSKKNGKWIVTE